MIIQFCGLSGSGKTTLANKVNELLATQNIACAVIDGDVYRKLLCADLGFSKHDRNENIRRLAAVAGKFSEQGMVAIICAINPYEEVRQEISAKYPKVKTIYIYCPIDVLLERDTKQLYHKALLPNSHPEKITNLSGINDPFEEPQNADLTINTDIEDIETSAHKLLDFILKQ